MHLNLSTDELRTIAISSGEAVELTNKAIASATVPHTGRSPNAKAYLKDWETIDNIDWSMNNAISRKEFDRRWADYRRFLATNVDEIHLQQLTAVRDNRRSIRVDTYTEFAKHAMFARNMFIPTIATEDREITYEILHFPSLSKEPEVLISVSDRVILISGTLYSGEIKKSIFSVLNYHFPFEGALPMHCSVNLSKEGTEPAIFFGLSGTGKTTLSSDENRVLIGDDEHGWTADGLTNFEGGCYAKTIRLSEEDEPQIYHASTVKNAILENVVIKNDMPDFDDASLSENGRASYPASHIPNAHPLGFVDEHPKNIIMLTCDAFGVLPAVCHLSRRQAVEQFSVGYTSKVAGTESDVKEPTATFSPCFGAPFMPLPISLYARLLSRKIRQHEVKCWLVNTGWTGGPYGTGTRMPIATTRLIIDKILDGTLAECELLRHEYTGFDVPACNEISSVFLRPEEGWMSLEEYEKKVETLMSQFKEKLSSIH